MSDPLAAARRLIGAGRTDLAERELRSVLGTDPESADAHRLLALCLTHRGAHAEALREIDGAIGRAPEHPAAWRTRSLVCLNLGRSAEAEEAADEAIRRDPGYAGGFLSRGQARFLGGRPAEALDDIDRSLALAPTEPFAHDLRARVLTVLSRNEEAAASAQEALRLAPESTTAHSARAWQLLHAGDRAEAQDEFREALRLDPTSNWARLGLIEAMKARNPVYRMLLRGLLSLQRTRTRGRGRAWVYIALAVGARAAGLTALNVPGAQQLVAPLVTVAFLLMLMQWSARPLFNAGLRLSRDGRHLLTAAERRESMLVTAAIAGGLVLAALWLPTGDSAFVLAGVSSAFLSVLVCVATQRSGRPGTLLWSLGAAAVTLMLAGLAIALVQDGGTLPKGGPASLLLAAPLFAAFASPWIGPRTRRRRPRRPAVAVPANPPRLSVHGWRGWLLTAIGFVLGIGLLGWLQTGDKLAGAVVCGAGFAGTMALPALRSLVRRRSRSALRPAAVRVMSALALTAAATGAAALATRWVPAEGAFVLSLFLLVSTGLVLDAETRRRRRVLISWSIACAVVVVGCGAAAVLGGSTRGANAVLTGPFATWAGTGLFGLLVTPIVAHARRPRRLMPPG